MMKHRLFLLLLALLATTGSLEAKKKAKEVVTPQYEIVSAGTGTQGTYLLKVTVSTKKGAVGDEDLKHAAVHGVIFRGFSAGNGGASQRPMVADITVEQQHKDYFNLLFAENGPYLGFANIVPGSYVRSRTADGYVKVGATIQVMKDNLRKELEQAGVVRSLSTGF